MKILKVYTPDHDKLTTGDKNHRDAFQFKESPGNYNSHNAICSQKITVVAQTAMKILVIIKCNCVEISNQV